MQLNSSVKYASLAMLSESHVDADSGFPGERRERQKREPFGHAMGPYQASVSLLLTSKDLRKFKCHSALTPFSGILRVKSPSGSA